MNRPTFDVLTESWIPVIRHDGSADELGILACLEQAHRLREIKDPSPIVEFGLYRLLVAFVLDALILADRRPEVPSDLRDQIDTGSFQMATFEDYVGACGDVFDLFHPEKPFLQAPGVSGEPKSVFDFYPVFPTGNNSTLFFHQTVDGQFERPRGVARLLATIAPFNVKVKTGHPRTVVGDPPIYALPVGGSLYQTIILNLPLPDPRFTLEEEVAAGPVWRSMPTDGQPSTTPAQSFTWPSRFVKVVPPEADGYIKAVLSDRGLRAVPGWKDPSCALFQDGEGRTRHLRLEESRPLWLDAGPLSFCSEGSTRRWGREWVFARPEVVENAFTVQQGKDTWICFYAWRTDQAKVLEWTRTRWSIPYRLGQRTRLGGLVQQELDRSEVAARELTKSVRALAPRRSVTRPGNRSDRRAALLSSLSDRCVRAYWQALERRFLPLLTAFAALDSDAPDDPILTGNTAKDWREAIKTLALKQFELAAKDMDTDAEALERLVTARTQLHGNLRKALS